MSFKENNPKGKQLYIAAIVVGVLAWQATTISAQTVYLTNQNSIARVDTDTSSGMAYWLVDGQNQLNQQWFWYRIGGVGGQYTIDTISAPVISTPAANVLNTTYSNASMRLSVQYTLDGGLLGSGMSDLGEQIQIDNLLGTALDLHFYEYTDFDLSGADTATLTQVGGLWYLAQQVGGLTALQETVASPGATYAQAAGWPTIRNALNSGSPYQLNNTSSFGPGDATYALQWDYSIPVGGSFLISKDKHIDLYAIPEPSVLALACVGFFTWFMRKRSLNK